jgi:HlyD family secretion protein
MTVSALIVLAMFKEWQMIKDTSGQDTLVRVSNTQKLKWPVGLGISALLMSALVWASFSSDQASSSVDASDLRFGTLTRGTLVRDIATTGKIVAANAPILYSTEEGVVSLLSQPGDEVELGQVVATIESPNLVSQLKQQQALLEGMKSSLELVVSQSLDMAKVDLEAADRESRRGDQLIENKLISKIDFEKSKDDLHKAKLVHKHAIEEVDLLKDTLSFELQNSVLEVDRQALVVLELERQLSALTIKAPVGGIIGNWLVEQKARIAPSQPLLTVVDLSAFEAELAVPEAYADELGLGMEVELNLGNMQLVGKLSSISPEVREREVSARVRFEGGDKLSLRQNQRLSARVLLENRPNVLMVKRGDFLGLGGNQVYVLEGNIATLSNIELGVRSMSQVEVLTGGKEGDVWVISGSEAFNNANKVQVN